MTPYRSGPGTRTAEVGQEAPLTTALRDVLRDVATGSLEIGTIAKLFAVGLTDVTLCTAGPPARLKVTCDRSELVRLHRLHYRRPHRGSPKEISVYCPEGVVTLRAREET